MIPNDNAWRADDRWRIAPDGALETEAAAGSDLFHVPGTRVVDSLSAYERAAQRCFTLTACVRAAGDTFADGAGILIRAAAESFKICIERTRTGVWRVVTVLSRPISDECYGPGLEGPEAILRLTCEGDRHAAFVRRGSDANWTFVRTFHWSRAPRATVGLFAQAPLSTGVHARFSSIIWEPFAVRDRR